MTLFDPKGIIIAFLVVLIFAFGGLVALGMKGPEVTPAVITPQEFIGDEGSSVLAMGEVSSNTGREFDWKFFIVPLPEEYGGPLPCTWVQQTGMSCDYSRRRYK